ncbi:hypothetical protein SS50377_20249 [Spironucleus salmonicida]|uniref:Uncharacterized protein n=1 Tax=Spironucleus salmonicida TaxID=348837 RepID=V6LM60_9EUKA|nr:hypothetical protein SS50377_20249 [Spironucleus salmonicida]|eukprot:EST45303.1 Hypothetical protein SS50377_14880 [Spironucleus salmonicida]
MFSCCTAGFTEDLNDINQENKELNDIFEFIKEADMIPPFTKSKYFTKQFKLMYDSVEDKFDEFQIFQPHDPIQPTKITNVIESDQLQQVQPIDDMFASAQQQHEIDINCDQILDDQQQEISVVQYTQDDIQPAVDLQENIENLEGKITQNANIEDLINKAVSQNLTQVNDQLVKQQQLIQQQMELIHAQEKQIQEAQTRQMEIDSLRTKAVIKSININTQPPAELTETDLQQSPYANAKLSLSSGFLIGSVGSSESFRIDLTQENVIHYQQQNLRLVIQGPYGPLTIRARNLDDYEKWVKNIQTSISRKLQSNTKPPSNTPKLLMQLDTSTQVLFVYQNGSQMPTKEFFVRNSEVSIKKDGDFGIVKVRCADGRKFSFGDKIDICEQWSEQFEICGASTKYI